MNIVYGGAFNPPTLAHLEICKVLKSMAKNLIIMPVSINYQKDTLINDDYRLDMVNIMALKVGAIVSRVELECKKYMGTYHTLNLLSSEYDDLYFVMGADNLENLNKWIRYEDLLNDYKFIVFERNDKNCSKIIESKYYKYKEKFLIIPFDMDISSTEIRNDLEKNKDKLLPEIYDYINSNCLYEVNRNV